MVARASADTAAEPRIGTFSEPPCPPPPALRSDIAYRRACGHPWEALGVSYEGSGVLSVSVSIYFRSPELISLHDKGWARFYRLVDAGGHWGDLIAIGAESAAGMWPPWGHRVRGL